MIILSRLNSLQWTILSSFFFILISLKILRNYVLKIVGVFLKFRIFFPSHIIKLYILINKYKILLVKCRFPLYKKSPGLPLAQWACSWENFCWLTKPQVRLSCVTQSFSLLLFLGFIWFTKNFQQKKFMERKLRFEPYTWHIYTASGPPVPTPVATVNLSYTVAIGHKHTTATRLAFLYGGNRREKVDKNRLGIMWGGPSRSTG